MTAFMTYKEECETLREQLSIAASEILSLLQQLAASKAWEEAVVCACMKVDSCLVANDPKQTLLNLEQYWFDTGRDEQKTAQETALILDPRQQLAVAKAENDSLRKANLECVEYFNEAQKDLAASQAREQKLLNHIALALEFCDMPAFSIAENLANALALPQDTSALEAVVAKAGEMMRERCAVEAYEWAMAYVVEDTAPVDNADAIRAIPAVTLEDLRK